MPTTMHQQEIIIRAFRAADLNALAGLTSELGYPTTPEEMKSRLDNMPPQAGYQTIVAVSGDDMVIGYIGISRQYTWEQNRHFVRIQALVVKKEFRRLGVGQQLIRFIEDQARQTHTAFMTLNCGNRAEREQAHQFYPDMGFEAKSTGYLKKLD